jgi:hypothetical protein
VTAIGPGVRVKCIKRDRWLDCDGNDQGFVGPEFSSVWTVKKCVRSFFEYKGPWIELAEWADSTWFMAEYFVPLDGNEDISVFTSILDRLPEKHKAPATV